MLQKMLYALAMRLPCRVIAEKDIPYLERYFVFEALGWRCYLHRFVGSDPDRGFHDHPWARAYSLILLGWYYELRRWGMRRVCWFNVIDGDTFHRVFVGDRIFRDELHAAPPRRQPPRQVWSLFFHRADDAKDWGFLRPYLDMEPGWLYTPYVYPGKEKNKRWELDAPLGRELRRNGWGVALADQEFYRARDNAGA